MMETNIAAFLTTAKMLGCENCGCLFLRQISTIFCPICGEQKVQEIENKTIYPDIEILIKHHNKLADYEQKIQDFINPVRFKTDQLNLRTIISNVQWVFLPFWLVDSKANGSWNADFGFNYFVESSVEHLQNNQWQTQKIKETRIDWNPRKGIIDKNYFNISISAQSLFKTLTKIFGSFDLSKAHENKNHYNFSDQVSLIIPNIDQNTGWQLAKDEFIKVIKEDCQRASGAQHTKTFDSSILFSDQNWTLLLLPYFVSHYMDDSGNAQTIWINGQSLQINGDRYSSIKKGNKFGFIYLGISILFLLFTLIFGYIASMNEFFGGVAFLCLFANLGFMIGALYSFFYPSHWNKKHTNIFNKAD